MNKNRINELIPLAIAILDNHKNKLDKSIRNNFSAFGSAIISTGIVPAILFNLKTDDKKIMVIILLEILNKDKNVNYSISSLDTSLNELKKYQDDFLHYVVSVKLACNLFIGE